MTDFDDECASVVIQAVANSPNVLDTDSMKVVHYNVDVDDVTTIETMMTRKQNPIAMQSLQYQYS